MRAKGVWGIALLRWPTHTKKSSRFLTGIDLPKAKSRQESGGLQAALRLKYRVATEHFGFRFPLYLRHLKLIAHPLYGGDEVYAGFLAYFAYVHVYGAVAYYYIGAPYALQYFVAEEYAAGLGCK